MDIQDLCKAIIRRKSIRKYKSEPLNNETLNKIKEFLDSIKPLVSDIKVIYKFATASETKGLFKVNAPHYLFIYSEKKERYLENIGFIGAHLDLYLSASNIGSCWLGRTKPIEKLKKSDMETAVAIAFGYSAEELHRLNVMTEYKRNNLSEISTTTGIRNILELVRLAPSSLNSQPWYFTGNESYITIYRKKLQKSSEEDNHIDMGIAYAYLFIVVKTFGQKITFEYIELTPKLKGYFYSISAKISQK